MEYTEAQKEYFYQENYRNHVTIVTTVKEILVRNGYKFISQRIIKSPRLKKDVNPVYAMVAILRENGINCTVKENGNVSLDDTVCDYISYRWNEKRFVTDMLEPWYR